MQILMEKNLNFLRIRQLGKMVHVDTPKNPAKFCISFRNKALPSRKVAIGKALYRKTDFAKVRQLKI